jgi:4-hydroxy-tetrahydrodipicolinate reductase
MPRKVVLCSLGTIGRLTLPLLLDRPEFELVGLWCHGDDKHGVDAGELAGREPVGLAATGDFDAIVELEADCVLFHSAYIGRPRQAISDMARLLRSGKNLITAWPSTLMWPPYGRTVIPDSIDEIEAAALEGGSSLFATGTDPGLATDALPALLSSASGRVDSVRMQEVGNYSALAPTGLLTAPEFLSFGQPLDYAGRCWVEEKTMQELGGAPPVIVAAALGYEPTRVEFFEHRGAATKRREFKGGGVIEVGTIGSRWFGFTCHTAGPTVTWEHITHAGCGIPDEWPIQRPIRGGYNIVIEGSPNMRVNFDMDENGDEYTGGMLITATRCANAVDAVCRAEPGIRTVFDFGLGDTSLGRPPRLRPV